MSLRARVLLGVLVLTTLAMAGLGVVVYSFLDRYLTQRVDEDLQRSSGPIISYVAAGPHPAGPARGAGLRPARLLHRRSATPTGRWCGSRPVDGRQRAAGRARSVRACTPSTSPQGVDYLTTDSVDGSPELPGPGDASSTTAPPSSWPRPLTDVEDTLDRLVTVEIVATVAVLVALGGLVTWVVRRGLRPLGDVVVAADAVADGDLSHRVPVPNPRTEVGHLGVAFNTMVDRIEESFAERDELEQRLRRFVADASHELRTPLTSIRGYAELFRRGAADDPDQLALAMRRIEDEASRMGVLVDDLLLLARLDQGRPLEREPVELVALVDDAVADARAVEPDRPITFRAARRARWW